MIFGRVSVWGTVLRGPEKLGQPGLLFDCVLGVGRTGWPGQVRPLSWMWDGQEGRPFSEMGMREKRRFVGGMEFEMRSGRSSKSVWWLTR